MMYLQDTFLLPLWSLKGASLANRPCEESMLAFVSPSSLARATDSIVAVPANCACVRDYQLVT